MAATFQRGVDMLQRISRATSRGTALAAGVVLVAMVTLVIVEIAMRIVMGRGTNVMVEFVGYGLITMTFLGAGQSLREGAIIRVNLLLRFVPPGMRSALDIGCVACGIFVVCIVAYFMYLSMEGNFMRGLKTDSLVSLPAWLPMLGAFVGILAFLLELITRLVLLVTGQALLPDNAPEVI